MKQDFIIVLFLIAGLQCLIVQGEFSCFKKYRRKSNVCGGPVRKKSLSTPDTCCTDIGQGYTEETLTKLGKNRYTCISCEEWERQKNSVNTPESQTEDFHCFRKFRHKKQQCGGPMKHRKARTVDECCNGLGNGFTRTGLMSHGKNRYTCMSCDEWRKSQGGVTTVSVATPKSTTPGHKKEWGSWGPCNTTCGIGWRVRYRACPTCERKVHVQSEPCVVQYYCPVDGNWGNWMSWTPCTASCNVGIRRRERFCNSPAPIHGGKDCHGSELDEETCNEEPCAVDGHWGHWSRFGDCSRSCGRGEMIRTRECNRPAPSGSGRKCRGKGIEARRCERRKCPQHGGWSSWEEWSVCPVKCGEGQRTRSRECNRPRPLFGGDPCAGSEIESDVCDVGTPCPIHGGWSSWSEFGRCRAGPCKQGHRLRTRVCDNPRPQHRGRMCRGRSIERISCMNEQGCPVNGGWCDYSVWSPCSATCMGMSATMSRKRSCYCPAPQNGGKSCEGDYIETIACTGTEYCANLVEAE